MELFTDSPFFSLNPIFNFMPYKFKYGNNFSYFNYTTKFHKNKGDIRGDIVVFLC